MLAVPLAMLTSTAKRALILLCLQNTLHALTTRYSRGVLKEDYSVSSSVLGTVFFSIYAVTLASELIKMAICCVAVIGTGDSFSSLILRSLPMAVPAGVYFLQNVLFFVALQRLDAGTAVVLQQLKILASGVFAGWILCTMVN